MPTERFACLAIGTGVMLALLFTGTRMGWPAHFLTFGLATALLWRGTAGRARCAVVGAVIGAAALGWLHHMLAAGRAAPADLIAAVVAALAVAGALFIRRKYLCAESSQP